MAFTPEDIRIIERENRPFLESHDPAFYADWDISATDAGIQAESRIRTLSGGPAAVWTVGSRDGTPGEIRVFSPDGSLFREDRHFGNGPGVVMDIMLAAGYGNVVPEDAAGGIDWMKTCEMARKFGALKYYATDFLYHDRNMMLAFPEAFKSGIMIMRETGSDLLFRDGNFLKWGIHSDRNDPKESVSLDLLSPEAKAHGEARETQRSMLSRLDSSCVFACLKDSNIRILAISVLSLAEKARVVRQMASSLPSLDQIHIHEKVLTAETSLFRNEHGANPPCSAKWDLASPSGEIPVLCEALKRDMGSLEESSAMRM